MIDTNAIRRRVLGLAMHGQLTTHFSDDGTAEELYLQIQEDKKRLEALGKVKKKSTSQIDTNGKFPYEIPASWKWVHLSDIALSIVAGGDKPSDFQKNKDELHTIPVVANGVDNDGVIGYTNEESKGGITITVAGRGTIGFTVYRDYKYYPVVRLIVIEPTTLIDPHYLTYVLQNSEFNSTGSSIPQLTVPLIAPTPVPLPPYKEQRRIVEVVDSVLFILDSIDDLQANYNDNRDALKVKIIDAGIQGKLTEQLPEDGTTEELCRAISDTKKGMQKRKEIKNSKSLPEISEDEIPFEVPSNWKWVHLDDITTKITSGSTPKGGRKSNAYVNSGNCFFREQNIYNDGIHREGMVYITDELLSTRENSTVIAKDILLNITGGSIGRCALIPDDFEKGSINQHILIIRMVDDRLRFYVHKLLCSPYVQRYIKDKSVGDKDGFSGGRCKQMLIPLPPLAEQQRIVGKIDEVLSDISMVG